MKERGESHNEHEIEAARTHLKEGIETLLQERWGVQLDSVLDHQAALDLELFFEEGHDVREIPQPLTNFVRSHFPNRLVDVKSIEVSYANANIYDGVEIVGSRPDGRISLNVTSRYPSSPEEAEIEGQRIVTGEDEITGKNITEKISEIESQEDFSNIILPDQRLVVAPYISLYPFNDPIEARMVGYNLDEWLEDREKMIREISAGERLKKRFGSGGKATDPYNLGIIKDRRQRPYRTPLILREEIDSSIVRHVAELIPDLSYEEAVIEREDSYLGKRQDRIFEPRKTLSIR